MHYSKSLKDERLLIHISSSTTTHFSIQELMKPLVVLKALSSKSFNAKAGLVQFYNMPHCCEWLCGQSIQRWKEFFNTTGRKTTFQIRGEAGIVPWSWRFFSSQSLTGPVFGKTSSNNPGRGSKRAKCCFKMEKVRTYGSNQTFSFWVLNIYLIPGIKAARVL